MSDLKKQVKIALIHKDSNMTELSKELGISLSYLSDILAGKRNNQEQIDRIKKYLDIKDVDDYEE